MGKWSGHKDQFEALPQDQTYQERINVRKQEILAVPRNLGELGELYNASRAEKDKLNDLLGEVNLQLESLTQLITAKLEETGLQSIKLTDGSSLTLKDDPYAQVQDRAVFLAWVREQGYQDLLTVHFQTTNSLVKERLANGEEPPPGIKVYIKTGLTRRKGTGA